MNEIMLTVARGQFKRVIGIHRDNLTFEGLVGRIEIRY